MALESCLGLETQRDPTAATPALTPRQREVLFARARGQTLDAIAYDLGLNPHTVKTHVTAAYQKLGAAGLIDALLILGWLRVPSE